MKYVVIIVVVILFVRIDYLLGLFDRASEKLSNAPSDVELDNANTSREIISVKDDRTLKRTKKDTFLALLEDFHSSPTPEIRQRAMSIFKEKPDMFTQKLDKALENHIFQWRDLLNNNEPEVVNFLLDLMQVLQGENLDMMKRFFALWMEINMEHFIAAYSRTKDTNCTIVTIFGDKIPEEEILNEYYDRQDALNLFLTKEKIDPLQKTLATNCLLQLGLIIEKLAPKNAPENTGQDTANQPPLPSTTTVQPDPQATGTSP